jgi:hypothetical protein
MVPVGMVSVGVATVGVVIASRPGEELLNTIAGV